MDVSNITLPAENVVIYQLTYSIEVGLREFIIDTLAKNYGSKWWKQRLPGDILQKFRDGQQMERSIKWLQFVPHHPLYYIDFPDLKKIITRQDNWKDVFQEYFKTTDIVLGIFSEIEPIRNKIAHNRISTQQDVNLMKAAYGVFSFAVGEVAFLNYINKISTVDSLFEIIKDLNQEVYECYIKITKYDNVDNPIVWEAVARSWWFDEEYLSNSVEAVRDFYNILSEYRKLPRSRGSGHKIEHWVNCCDILTVFDKASKELSQLLSQMEG
jgi:hypothetical protein